MKFNVEKLKAIARPMSPEDKAAFDFRNENEEWLYLSSIIAYKIRMILSDKGLSQSELSDMLSVTPAQVSKLLSGKVNFELKTIAKLQAVLGEPIIEVNLLSKKSKNTETDRKEQSVEPCYYVNDNKRNSTDRVAEISFPMEYKICE